MCRAVENDNQEKYRAVQVLQYHRALIAAVAVISSIGHGGGVGSIRPGPELIALTGQAAAHLTARPLPAGAQVRARLRQKTF